jgi:hypothetical protein
MHLNLNKTELTIGLEIKIEGLTGDPTEDTPGTSIYLEYYNGKVLCHIWTEGKEECKTIELT